MDIEYRIVEYRNPFQPNVPMYKCKIGNEGICSQHLCTVFEWKIDRIKNKFKHSKIAELNYNAAVSFFENSNTSKD